MLAIPLPLRRRAQVDAADEKCKLFASQLRAAIFGRRPMQSPLLHAPRTDPQVVFTMPLFAMWLINRELLAAEKVPRRASCSFEPVPENAEPIHFSDSAR